MELMQDNNIDELRVWRTKANSEEKSIDKRKQTMGESARRTLQQKW